MGRGGNLKISPDLPRTDIQNIFEKTISGTDGIVASLETLKSLIQSSRLINDRHSVIEDPWPQVIHYVDGLIRKAKENLPQISIMAASRELTSRERQVLKLIANGLANKNIASALKISIRTVEAHRLHLVKKLGVKTTAGLVKYAISNGFD